MGAANLILQSGAGFMNDWLESDEENSLARAARRGDRRAFMKLVRRYDRAVYRMTFALTRQHRVAGELAAEAFLVAWRSRMQTEHQPFYAFLLRVARNLAITYRRKAGPDGGRPTPNPHASRGQRFEHAFAGLSPEQQQLLVLRVVERMRYARLSEILDLPPATTLSRIALARAELRTRFDGSTAEKAA